MAPTTKAAAKATKAPAKTAKKAPRPAGSAKKAAAAAPASKSSSTKKAPTKKAMTKKEPAKKAEAKKGMGTKATPTKATAKKPAPATKKAATKGAGASAGATKAPAKPVVTKAAAKPVVAKPVVAKPVVAKKSASRGTIPALAKRVPSDNDRKPPPKRTGPLDKFLLDQLADLNEERITYTRQAASLKAEADLLVAEREPGDVQFDEESGEGDTLAVERERDLALSASAQNAVEDIDRAIAKIHDGTYGICEQCYAKIPKERLRALPYAALCVQCKSAGFSRR